MQAGSALWLQRFLLARAGSMDLVPPTANRGWLGACWPCNTRAGQGMVSSRAAIRTEPMGLLSFSMPVMILLLIQFLLAFAAFHLTHHISANVCSILLRGNCEKIGVLRDCLNVFLLQFLWAGFYLQQHWSNPGGSFRWTVLHFSWL